MSTTSVLFQLCVNKTLYSHPVSSSRWWFLSRMPIPEALRALASARRFWTDFFWNTEAEEEYYSALEETVHLDFPVTSDHACPYISLEFTNDLSSLSLDLKIGSESHQLGWDDQAHWHPHVLRWDELDLICRAIARREPELPHPGLPLLLLHRFAPICGERGGEDDDADFASSLLDAAWRRLGLFSDREIQQLIERYDARDAGFRWRPGGVEGTWVLCQEKLDAEGDLSSSRSLYTLRSEYEVGGRAESEEEDESDEEEYEDDIEPFPHTGLMTMLEAARETVLRSISGESIPDGILASEHPPRPHYTLRSKYSMRLSLPLQDGPRPLVRGARARVISPLSRILSDLDIGSAQLSGECSTLKDGVRVAVDKFVSVQIEGDRARGMCVIREVLQWVGASTNVRLWGSGPNKIALNIGEEYSTTGELHFQLATYAAPTPGEEERPTLFRITFPASCADALRADPEATIKDPHADGWLAVVPHGTSEATVQDPDRDGWLIVLASDGGEMGACFTPREDNKNFTAGSLAIRKLSPALVGIIYRFLASQSLALFPPGIVTAVIPREMEADTVVVKSDAELHEVLAAGPYAWWSRPEGAS